MTQSAHQLRRIFDLFMVLPVAPQDYVTVADLLKKPSLADVYFEGRERSAAVRLLQRDLDALQINWPQAMDIDAVTRASRRPVRYRRYNYFLSDLMSSEMALSLMLAQPMLEDVLPPDWYQQLDGLFESAQHKLEKHSAIRDWHQRVKVLPEGILSSYYGDHHVIGQALKALADGTPCEIEYCRELDQEIRTYRIAPQGLVMRGGKRFLLATNLKQGYTNTFALHRIQRVDAIEFELHDCEQDVDLKEWIRTIEYESADRHLGDVTIRLLCDERLRWVFEATNLSESVIDLESIEDAINPQEGFIVTLSEIVSESLETWLWQHSDQIEVLEPAFLRTRILERLHAAHTQYNKTSARLSDDEHTPTTTF